MSSRTAHEPIRVSYYEPSSRILWKLKDIDLGRSSIGFRERTKMNLSDSIPCVCTDTTQKRFVRSFEVNTKVLLLLTLQPMLNSKVFITCNVAFDFKDVSTSIRFIGRKYFCVFATCYVSGCRPSWSIPTFCAPVPLP